MCGPSCASVPVISGDPRLAAADFPSESHYSRELKTLPSSYCLSSDRSCPQPLDLQPVPLENAHLPSLDVGMSPDLALTPSNTCQRILFWFLPLVPFSLFFLSLSYFENDLERVNVSNHHNVTSPTSLPGLRKKRGDETLII